MRKIRYILFITLLFTLRLSSFGQFYTIPDPNFRTYLVNNHASLLNGSQQLIIASANKYTGDISCNNLNIQDFSGLEYFYKITILNCSNNPISSLPSFDSLRALTAIWAEGCGLTQFPNINHLTTLQTFVVKSNKLTALPVMSALVNLQYFDCSANQITQLPDLTNMVSLQKLFFWDNMISQIPDLSNLVNLQVLDFPVNKVSVLPSLSSNNALQILRCNNNQLTVLPSLNNLSSLVELSVNTNKLTQFPDLSSNTQLQVLDVAFNKLTKFPDLSGYTSLSSVKMNNNQLGFSEMIPQTFHPSFNTVFQVSPQDTLFNYPLLQLSRSTMGIIPCGIDANITSDSYQWYKNGILINNSTGPYIILNPPVSTDSGNYFCKITNTTPALAGVILNVKAAKVIIGACISATIFDYKLITNKCMQGADIEIDEASIISSYKPFKYELIPVYNQSGVSSNSFMVKNIQPGKYDLKITDQNNCSIYLDKYINIPVASDCDNIITPNGDGIDDTYFVEKTGKARVFNKDGKLFKEMTIPAQWDGMDNNGNLVPMGYYIILINEKEKVGVIVLN